MDAAEFDAFYTGSYRRIVGQLYVMIGNRDEAAECVQEAFVRAWDHGVAWTAPRTPGCGRRPTD